MREEVKKAAAKTASDDLRRRREADKKRREEERKKALEDCREGSIVLQEKFRMEYDDREAKENKRSTKKHSSTADVGRKEKRSVDDDLWGDGGDIQFDVSELSKACKCNTALPQ